MSHFRAITEADLDHDVLASEVPVLLDFTATWCGPCRVQHPLLHDVAAQVGERAHIFEVDVDHSPALAARYGVRSVPTLVVLKDGVEVRRFRGVTPSAVLTSALEAAR